LKVIRNKCAKVVPNAAPSTAALLSVAAPCEFLYRMGGGWYTFEHLGQNVLTVSAPISSLRPTGKTGCP
jgi:hypothetical protein